MKLSLLSERWNHIAHGPLKRVDLLELYETDQYLFVQAATRLIKRDLSNVIFKHNINKEDLDDAIQHALTEILVRPKFPPKTSHGLLKMLKMLTWWKLQAIWKNRKVYRRADTEYQREKEARGDTSIEPSKLEELLAAFEKSPEAKQLSPKKMLMLKLKVAGYSQTAIAKELGVSTSHISQTLPNVTNEFRKYVNKIA
jgi:RNA polymerase sigma factor (sigma-70 family)